MSKIKVGIVVLNWKQPELTKITIESLQNLKHSYFDYQIILVDNASPDNSWEIFTKLYSRNPKITLLKTSSNLGYVGGNNYGIVSTETENFNYYLILNNDVKVDPNFLDNMVRYAKSEQNIGLMAPKIYFAPGYEYQKNIYKKSELGNIIWFAGGTIDWQNIYCSHIGIDEVDQGQFENISEPDYLTGCCLLISYKLIKKIGLLDMKYYLYMEDADYCMRAKLNNFKIIYYPKSYIWHLNSGSSGANSDLHHYFLTRNRLLFGYKYASFRTKLALFKQSISMLLTSPSFWQKKGIIDYYLTNLKQGSWK